MFCKHDWQVVDKQVLESPMEQMDRLEKMEITKANGGLEYFRKKYICVLKCSKCYKIKTVVEVNP